MKKQKYKYMVWAESDYHTTHSALLDSYKEAQAEMRDMKRCLYSKMKYKFRIEKYPAKS